ncbi:MAG: acetyl-CoA acetyltransferase [Moraxellaceae bacterium]
MKHIAPADNTPILVGAGQLTNRKPPLESPTPLTMMADVARLAAANAGIAEALLSQLDTVATTRLASDSTEAKFPIGEYRNLPKSLGLAVGAAPTQCLMAGVGGNTPQQMVNAVAERIAAGKTEFALLAGSENLQTLMGSIKSGVFPPWGDEVDGTPELIGSMAPGCSAHEQLYGFFYPINTYPLFENALREHRGTPLPAHMKKLGNMFSRMSAVAAENPLSWFPTFRSPEEISTVTEKNRYVGFPYTKYLNSVIQVDMAAAVIMTSVKKARELGIPEERWVYLNGCADAQDHWFMGERENFYSSAPIRAAGKAAFGMAGITPADLDFMDIYSCFPSAVQIACHELGIDEEDKRGLTITGAMPYFGGPGNNYSMNSLATMLDKLRAQPGSHGLVTANGWHITKYSVGIYSTQNLHAQWQPAPSVQAELDARPKTPFVEVPETGPATIETWTVTHNAQGPQEGILFLRLADGSRCLANTPAGDKELLERMKKTDCVGKRGTVSVVDGRNVFVPENI